MSRGRPRDKGEKERRRGPCITAAASPSEKKDGGKSPLFSSGCPPFNSIV